MKTEYNSLRMLSLFSLSVLGGLFLGACSNAPNLETVNAISLEKYAGRWYEIATIPIYAQRNCQCTFAEYTLDKEGFVRIYNQCRDEDGKLKDINGKAFPVKGSNNSKLKVQFFWPFKADYQIIAIAEDYSYAMVGSPNRKTLWILAREKQLDQNTYQELLNLATKKGFDTGLLVRTKQNCEETNS